jgi:hypothetical protein
MKKPKSKLPERLQTAYDFLVPAVRILREAHTDAINDGNEFAEIVLLQLIGDSRELPLRVERAIKAAKGGAK